MMIKVSGGTIFNPLSANSTIVEHNQTIRRQFVDKLFEYV